MASPEEKDPFPPKKRAQLFATMKKLREGDGVPPFGKCMYWNDTCNAPPIGSHSLSKCWLETIMCERHVMKITMRAEKNARGQIQPTISPDMQGWNEASVFQGFCSYHDTYLFRNLDRLDVSPTVDDCMRLVYRSVCREAAAKHQVVSVCLSQGMGKDERGMKHVMPQVLFGIQLFSYKVEIEQALATGNYDNYEHLVFDMGSQPFLLGTTTFMPLVTVRGRTLGQNSDLMTLTVLPTQAAGLAILTWNRIDNPNGAKFAQALRRTPKPLLGMAIARTMIEISDSVCYSPLYWLSLPDEKKQWLVDTHARSIVNNENIPPAHVLVPDPRTDTEIALPITDFRTLTQ